MPKILTEQWIDCWYCGHILKVKCKWKPSTTDYVVCPFCGEYNTATNGKPVEIIDIETGQIVDCTNGAIYESNIKQ